MKILDYIQSTDEKLIVVDGKLDQLLQHQGLIEEEVIESDDPKTIADFKRDQDKENKLIRKVGVSSDQLMKALLVLNIFPQLLPIGRSKIFNLTQDGNQSSEGYSTLITYTVPANQILLLRSFDIPAYTLRDENIAAGTVKYLDPIIPSINITVDDEDYLKDEQTSVKEGMGILPRGFDFIGLPAIDSGQTIKIRMSAIYPNFDFSLSRNFAFAIHALLFNSEEFTRLKDILNII